MQGQVDGQVKVAGIAPRADGDQREQPRVVRGVRPLGSGQEAAYLRQRVAEDVGEPVAVPDQALDGIEPVAVADCIGPRGPARTARPASAAPSG